jgi:hypothetical protein
VDVAHYCREIETYLCRKNDGHLIRVVGPSFELVSAWAQKGVPLKVAYAGIDRYFERYYRSGPRRRPVKIDFCDADVLDVFDEWRRSVGVPQSEGASPESRGPSLPAHLQRVVLRLSSARANGSISEAFDTLIDRVCLELDAARATASGLRGTARQGLIDRLAMLDAELLQTARAAVDDETAATLTREAEEELSAFRAAMPDEAWARAREAALERLVRERFKLPTVRFG